VKLPCIETVAELHEDLRKFETIRGFHRDGEWRASPDGGVESEPSVQRRKRFIT
jgi:hypothetical protein